MDNNSFDRRDNSFSERIFGKKRPPSTSKALWWAREQGLNCELDIMSQHLRMEYLANIFRGAQTALLVLIALSLALGELR